MHSIVKSVRIHINAEKLYRYILRQPGNLADWWPAFERYESISASDWRYVMNITGMRIKGEMRLMEEQLNTYLRLETRSGLVGRFEFILNPMPDASTDLTICMEYELPGEIIDQLFDKMLIEMRSESDLDRGLQQLKTMLESTEYETQVPRRS